MHAIQEKHELYTNYYIQITYRLNSVCKQILHTDFFVCNYIPLHQAKSSIIMIFIILIIINNINNINNININNMNIMLII